MKPKKSLGQCFLINKNAAMRIASLLNLTPYDRVMEIGGGRGDLTEHLLATGAQVTVVEIDKDLLPVLKSLFDALDNFTLIERDILEVDPSTLNLASTGIKLVGNIPYHLTSPIMEWLVSHRDYFTQALFTVQKEVADRLAAEPGSKLFGSITVFVQLFFSAHKVFDIKPGSFFPPPKVVSTVIELTRLPQPMIATEEMDDLRRLTRACFRWRRKQIVRILREEYSLELPATRKVLQTLSIPESARPEQLSVADFVALSRELACQHRDSLS
jgi:16S rRNA (adenine1518-N6/adenine1519-N6)-dimethyltransferase